jgi:hypothetical protein
VTVLEEAHNILKKTSTEQMSESSNLVGKSVEMISNAIAEMRTYGEAFIIADQAPALLDMAAIRNTNTKIIMRLPDYTDRELVGKSAGLNENQIEELSRLEVGVACVSQSGWLEPVLTKIHEFKVATDGVKNTKKDVYDKIGWDRKENVEQSLLQILMKNELSGKGDAEALRAIKDSVINSRLDTAVKCAYMELISGKQTEAEGGLKRLVYELFDASKAIEKATIRCDIESWMDDVIKNLSPSVSNFSQEQLNLLLAIIIHEQVDRDARYESILGRYYEHLKETGGIRWIV